MPTFFFFFFLGNGELQNFKKCLNGTQGLIFICTLPQFALDCIASDAEWLQESSHRYSIQVPSKITAFQEEHSVGMQPTHLCRAFCSHASEMGMPQNRPCFTPHGSSVVLKHSGGNLRLFYSRHVARTSYGWLGHVNDCSCVT